MAVQLTVQQVADLYMAAPTIASSLDSRLLSGNHFSCNLSIPKTDSQSAQETTLAQAEQQQPSTHVRHLLLKQWQPSFHQFHSLPSLLGHSIREGLQADYIDKLNMGFFQTLVGIYFPAFRPPRQPHPWNSLQHSEHSEQELP